MALGDTVRVDFWVMKSTANLSSLVLRLKHYEFTTGRLYAEALPGPDGFLIDCTGYEPSRLVPWLAVK